MVREFTDLVDPWRYAQQQRTISGEIPVAAFTRLVDQLHSDEGQVAFTCAFERNPQGRSAVQVKVEGKLQLMCQRSLKPFWYQVNTDTTVGLIEEDAEAELIPEAWEPFLVEGSQLKIDDLIEEELLLAMPVVAFNPDAPEMNETQEAESSQSPFAKLKELL